MTPDPSLLQRRLAPFVSVRRWRLAYSGGLDSHVLLHLAVASGLNSDGRLEAVHIHHGLQADADRWAEHCEARCRDLGVAFRVIRVEVQPGGSGEACARDARYRAFEELLEPGDGLLMAHHGDDQAETLLLRLLRGAGVRGLSAIPAERALGRGRLVRPLLEHTRADLKGYAAAWGLSWIEDPSNWEIDYDRNFLRREVVPLLKARWPGMERVLARTAEHCAETDHLLSQLGAEDLALCGGAVGSLRLDRLCRLDRARQKNLVRCWVESQKAPLPDAVHLRRILDEVVTARADAQPCVAWSEIEVRRYRGRLYLKSVWPEPPAEMLPWQTTQPLEADVGRLWVETVVGSGLRLFADSRVEVGFRRGGERLRLPGREGSRSLKKLLQEAGVPPWVRSWLPLIYVDGELAAVADLWVCRGFEVGAGEPGLRLRWQPYSM